jgi:hypothetical protein
MLHYHVHCLAIRNAIGNSGDFYIMNRLAQDLRTILEILPIAHGTFIISVFSSVGRGVMNAPRYWKFAKDISSVLLRRKGLFCHVDALHVA